jgi:plasmid stabilization system protein ParE
MARVRWTAGAREEFSAIVAHLKRDAPKLASEVLRQVLKVTRLLGQFPELGQTAKWADDPGVREAFILKRYRLVYRTFLEEVVISALVPVGFQIHL